MIINLHLVLSKLTPSSFCIKDHRQQGTHTAVKNHNKLIKLVPGTWSRAGQVPCQFNSYFFFFFLLSWTLSYTTKNLARALSFTVNKIYETLNTNDIKTLVPNLLIGSRACPLSIIESKNPWHKQIMLCPTSLIWLKSKKKSIYGQYQYRCDRKLGKLLNIVKTEKVGPGSVFHDMVLYFTCI